MPAQMFGDLPVCQYAWDLTSVLDACRSWIVNILSVSDVELLHTAGLDAFIFHRAFTWGLLFLGPVTVLAMVLCERPSLASSHLDEGCMRSAIFIPLIPDATMV